MTKPAAKKPLIVLFLLVFIDLVGFGIVIPILPYYATQFGASAFELGLLMMVYSLMQFLVSPFWGRLSDRIGRRPVLLGSLFGTGLSFLFLGFAQSLFWLFVGRIFAGICGANISTAYAYITDVTTEENRAKGMGIIGAGFGLGFIFGPAIGGILSQWSYSLPMFVAAGLCFVNLIQGYFQLPEPPLSAETREKNRGRKFNRETIALALSHWKTRTGIILFFLATFGVAQMETTFAIFLARRYQYDARQAGMLLALSGIIAVILQGGLIGRLSKKFGEIKLILYGMIIGGIGFILFAIAPDLPGAIRFTIAALCFMAIGMGMTNPSISSLTSKGAEASQRGAVMGVFHSAGSLARVMGPPTAGLLYDHWNDQGPYFSAAFLFWIAGVIALKQLRAHPAHQK